MGRHITLPLLYVGTWRSIMFPERGRNVPFTIENYAYRDSLGRETVSWARTSRRPRDVGSMHTWSGANSEAGSWTTWGPISTWRSILMCR